MKRIVSLIVLILLFVNCTFSVKQSREYRVKDPIVISERVGEVIDYEEREYFRLFPKIYVAPVSYPFESATFSELEGGGYEVRIATEYGAVVALNRDPNAVAILRDYIDSYEEIVVSRQAFEEKWGIVDYDALGQPITKKEIESVIKPRNVYTCAAIGGVPVCVGGCLSAVATLVVSGFDTQGTRDAAKITLYTVGATTLVMFTGGLVGWRMDNTAAKDAIKEARKPRRVEPDSKK